MKKNQSKHKYLMGHFGRIADWYWHKANPKLYEVIWESTPCPLCFDLEFSKLYNPDIDPTHLLEDFWHELQAELQTQFQVTFALSQLIDLDLIMDVKISCHWVLDLKDCLFHDAPLLDSLSNAWWLN
jgi:hypothetical protein